MLELDPFDALAIAMQQAPGTYALLVGSGLSRAAGIPTGWEITLELVRKLASVDGEADDQDWAAWYLAKHGTAASYSELLDALAATPSERRELVHSFIEAQPGEESRKPTKAHRAIARLVEAGIVRVIVTPNFDRLLESAIREVGIEPTVIINEDSLSGALPLVHSRCTIIKVHGDYLDARILNTEAELDAYPPALDAYLDQVFDQFGLLVVGWSADWDYALRKALMRAPSRRYSTFWASRGEPKGLASDVIAHRAARRVTITDAEAFLPRLADTVEALAKSARPHPQSVAAGLALAKRYCRDPAFNVEWAEFLAAECERIQAYIGSDAFPTMPPTPQAEADAVAEMVGRSELIRRSILIAARWGTPEATAQALRAIRTLATATSKSTYVRWIESVRLPASLCFVWAVAGALDRGDYALAGSFMRAVAKRQFKEPASFVSLLPLEGYDEAPNWRALCGANVDHAASVWLASLFAKEAGDISLLGDDVPDLFQRAQFLIAAENGVERNEVAKAGKWHFWTYPGTYLYDRRQTLTSRVAAMVESATSGPLAGAGLGVSNPTVAQEVGDQMLAFFGRFGIH